MNLFKKTLLSLAIAFSAGAANAEIILDSVTASAVANPTVTITNPVTFQHDITDGLNGYAPNIDSILEALLTINLFDHDGGKETFAFTLGSGLTLQPYFGGHINNGNGNASYEISLTTSLADLVKDGLLSVTLSASEGEFRFVSSTLSADVQRPVPPSDIPEPASIALLGLGLLSIAASRRKFSKK